MKKDQGEDVIKQCAIKHDLTDADLEFMQERINHEADQVRRPDLFGRHRHLHLYRIFGKVTELTINELINYTNPKPDYDYRAICLIICTICGRNGIGRVYFWKSQIITIHVGKMIEGILGCKKTKESRNKNFLKGELQDDHTIKYVEV